MTDKILLTTKLSFSTLLYCGLVLLLNTFIVLDPANIFEYQGCKASGCWITTLNRNFNAYHMWRPDLVANWLTNNFIALAPALTWQTTYLTYISTLSFLGVALFFFSVKGDLLKAISFSILFNLSLILLYQKDPVILSCFTWLGFFLFAWNLALKYKKNIGLLLFAVMFTILLGLSSNQFVLIQFIFGLVVLSIFTTSREQTNRLGSVTVFLLLIGSVCLYYIPTPYLPDYPQAARVVEDSGISVITRPRLGSASIIPFVDRNIIRSTFVFPALILCAMSIVIYFSSIGSNFRKVSLLAILGITAALALAWDTVLPEYLSEIGPIMTIARLIPGMYFLSPTPLLYSLAIMVVILALYLSERLIIAATTLLLLIVANPYLRAVVDEKSLTPGLFESAALKTQLPVDSKLVSPSHQLLTLNGAWFFSRQDKLSNLKFHTLGQSLVEQVRAPSRDANQSPELMFDEDLKTRWTAGQAKQDGTEYIYIKFNQTISLEGILLDAGAYSGDYPQGLAVYSATNCPTRLNNVEDQTANSTEIIKYPKWYGAIKLTKDGYPYYNPMYKVEVVFPHAVRGNCILVKQIGQGKNLDWSVAEFKVSYSK